jgi:PAS domain S-box-containing protein
VRHRLVGSRTWVWQSGQQQAGGDVAPLGRRVTIHLALSAPTIALVLVMVGLTAYLTLRGAEADAQKLAARLHEEVAENIKLRLDGHLARAADGAAAAPDIGALLRELRIAGQGRAYVVDQAGRLVASSLGGGAPDPVLAAAQQRLQPLGAASGIDGQPFTFDVLTAKPLARDTWLARVTPYRNGGHANWLLLTVLPEVYYLGGVREGHAESAKVLAAALALSLALAAVLAALVTAPIARLSRATQVLAREGALAQPLPGSRLEELDVLSESFNDMARQLCERTQRLHLATSVASLGVWDWDPVRDRLTWDDAMLQQYGLPAGGFEGSYEAWRGMLAPEDSARVEAALQAALRGEREFDVEFRIVRPDGSTRVLRGLARTLRDAAGRALRMVGVNYDITERKHAEAELVRHRDHLEQLVAQRTAALSAAAAQAESARVSQARLQAQLERLQLLDQITRGIGERQDLHSIYQVAAGSLEEHLPVDFACICRYDAVDHVLAVACIGQRTAKVAQAMALGERSSVPIDRNGLERCVGGELVYEPDVREVAFPFPQRLAAAGLSSLVAVPLRSESRVFGVLAVARRGAGAFSSGECEFLRQLCAHVALAAQQAELLESLRHAYDDLRRTQQAVMQQERLRALGQMASGIAHDINNAISPVSIYAESLLETEAGISARGRAALETTVRAIHDVAATVARMGEFYRQRETQDALEPMSMNTLVQQVADLTRARWQDMPQQRGVSIRLHMELAPDLPDVPGIESEVREALVNLVFNAVDAMPEGGVLTLRTEQSAPRPGAGQASMVAVEVEDTGIGMDDATKRRCLEPFFTTKGERGTGLGLAMVYGIAQRHGAGVHIDSAPGRGTRVRLEFLVAAMVVAATAEPATHRPVKSLRILLVDDDPLIVRSLTETLLGEGHQVISAVGGQAGIDAITRARAHGSGFDVVITDLGMPHVDGRQVAAAVKSIDPAMAVLLLTGWGRRLVADGEVPPHVDAVLSKPPRLRELREALSLLATA